MLKGEINISSKIKEGTCVTLKIPVSKHYINRRIVIIEDNYANRFILQEFISSISDFIIEVYENGEEALENIINEPLIILMDLHMPKIDGHDTSILLRKRGYVCPIVAISANGMKSERIKCIESGIDDFVLKPVNKDDIENILKKFKII